ncbi:MAG: hypothetical protein NTY53_24860 [Kiritimatiellaeota bacterium]|nr:hypothetical protein [Kiritimatiellota bacterium]
MKMPNADTAREFVEQIVDLWRKRRTFKGLFGFLIVVNSILFAAFSAAYFVLSKTEVIVTASHYANYFVVCGLIFGFGNLGMLVIWAYWRTLPIASSDNIEILFAPSADPEASDLVYKIYEKFRFDISARKMGSIVKCRHLPENIHVRDNQDAHVLLVRTGARLVVYGLVGRGKLQGDQIEGFRSISFTVRHRNLAPQEHIPIAKDLAAALASRTFCAREANSFIEQDVVIGNISEVSRFFIALAVTLDGRIDDAIQLLNPLLNEVEAKAQAKANNPHLILFLEAIKSCLTVALQTKFTRVYEACLVDHITEREYDEQARQCDAILTRLLQLNRRTASFFLGSAIIRFHFGDIDGAKAAVEHAKRLSSFDNAAPHLSMAFLHLWKNQYRQAFMQYMRAGKCKNQDMQTITSVLLFLNTMLRLYPDRQELRFAIGFVNDRFFDQQVALGDYQSFLAGNPKPELDEFRVFAERQSKKIHDAETV